MPQIPLRYRDIVAGIALGVVATLAYQRHRTDGQDCPAWALYGTRGAPERRCFYARMESANMAIYCAQTEAEGLATRQRILDEMRAEGIWRDDDIAIQASLTAPLLQSAKERIYHEDSTLRPLCLGK